MIPNKPGKRRRGSMLIEMSVAISSGALAILLGVGLIERTFRLSRTMQEYSELQRQLNEVARAWRADFATATVIEHPSEDAIRILNPTTVIVYKLTKSSIHRETYAKGMEVEVPESAKTRERYSFGTGYRASVKQNTLRIHTLNAKGESASLRLRVVGIPKYDGHPVGMDDK